MITLGLDPSLSGFGWCVHDSSKLGAERIVQSGLFTTSPKTVWVHRYTNLRENVAKVIDRYLIIEAVGVESSLFGEQWSEGAYALFVMINEAILSRRKDVVFFDPGTIKMLTKGDHRVRKGKMYKGDMVDAAKAETGKRLNHNIADAYHVARSAARFWMLFKGQITEEDLLPAEYHAFSRIHTFVRGKRAGETVKYGAIFKENQRFFRWSQYQPEKSNA
jgi:Holliday junction resolvasome RuvABC endonuclease subunit